jgi:hypothetical protein
MNYILPIISLILLSLQPCTDGPWIWKHVYNPDRLIVHKMCVSVTGTIVDATHGKRKDGLRHEADGDCHGWLKLDKGQESYLNKGNMSDEGGNLVFEVVCMYPVTQADAKATCSNYTNQIKVPPVGTHVEMSGSWVQDTNHSKWNELHPVFKITPHTIPPSYLVIANGLDAD